MFQIAKKDLKLFFSDKRAVLLTFLLPVSLITLFALAFEGGSSGKGEAKPVTLVLVDLDNTKTSRKIILGLDSLKELRIRSTTLDTAQNWIKKGNQNSALVLHKGLEDSLNTGKNSGIELQYDQAKEMEIGILQSALIGNLTRILGTGRLEKKALDDFDRNFPGMDSVSREKIGKQIIQNFHGNGADNPFSSSGGTTIKTTPLLREKDNSPGLVQAVAGTAIMMLLFSVTGMGASLLDERQEGTLKKLLCSPLHPSNILFGKMLSVNFISILQLTVMFIFAWLVFGLNIFQNIPALALMIIVTAFACSGFGVLLASIAKSRSQVQGFSTLIILVMSCLGGSMVPLFVMPEWMQKIAVVSMNYWGIQGFYDIFWRLLSVSDPVFLTRIAVLGGIGLVLNTTALQMFKKNVREIA